MDASALPDIDARACPPAGPPQWRHRGVAHTVKGAGLEKGEGPSRILGVGREPESDCPSPTPPLGSLSVALKVPRGSPCPFVITQWNTPPPASPILATAGAPLGLHSKIYVH